MAHLQIADSHISCSCQCERELSVFELSDIVRNLIFFPTDYIAFVNRAQYEVVLDTYHEISTNTIDLIPVFEPFLDPPPEGYLFTPGEVPFDIPFASANNALMTALHDLGQALRFPRRTMEYCRMSVEAIRFHFDLPEEKKWRTRWLGGEKAMCAALRVDRSLLRWLEREAAPGRHGEPLYNDWQTRSAALQLSWEMVFRFRKFLDGENTSDWPLVQQI